MIRGAFLFVLLGTVLGAAAQDLVAPRSVPGAFAVAAAGKVASVYVDSTDDWLVQKAAALLQTDLEAVTGHRPLLLHTWNAASGNCIVVAGLHAGLVQKMVAAGQLDVQALDGKWEAFSIQTVHAKARGAASTLVITGSDKRGVAYGVFELSRQLGVSPWYWWADVPVKKKAEVFIRTGVHRFNSPSVKYRGIFINDEAPAFSGWTKEKFGGVNHLVYEKVFELLLRLKANFLWPAMWGNAFNDDDPLNPVLADKWGIVMSTSHHEPMLRAQQEWKRYGKGAWNYDSNAAVLQQFWRKGIENMGTHESVVTVGMRGDGDMPMTRGTATSLLEKIVADQRKIIAGVTGKPASATPQVWALYKEVQDYYDKGMRVPDDVTLLLCDDNWGNIRKLPRLTDKPRSGGYGIYYHFDYVGGPRNYKWLNTNNIARVWEQMHLAYEYGVNKIWVVNVGDLKPVELPISFFLDYAWDTKRWNEDNLSSYYTRWADEQFGPAHAEEIGGIMQKYARYSARRKPELLDQNTYSLTAYGEAHRMVEEYNQLLQQAQRMDSLLPAGYRDAFFELVLHPVLASANLTELYLEVAENHYRAAKNLSGANTHAVRVKQLYQKDSLIGVQYHALRNGKWNHMMDQTHIGYTYWQQPPVNKMPAVVYGNDPAGGGTIPVTTNAAPVSDSRKLVPKEAGNRFYEKEGTVSMEAEHWTKAVQPAGIRWKVISGIGREGAGVTTFPVTAALPLGTASPHLEYDFYCTDTGQAAFHLFFSPTLNFSGDTTGLQYAVSLDNEAPQVFSLNREDANVRTWEGWVASNIILRKSTHALKNPGKHTLKYWMISPAVVLQKLVVDFGGLLPSYLGPPETKF